MQVFESCINLAISLQKYAVKLDAYWESLTTEQRKEFIEKLGIKRDYLYQLRKQLPDHHGKPRRPSLELAVKIEEVTKGKVKVKDLL